MVLDGVYAKMDFIQSKVKASANLVIFLVSIAKVVMIRTV
jgi:hypothetical protein